MDRIAQAEPFQDVTVRAHLLEGSKRIVAGKPKIGTQEELDHGPAVCLPRPVHERVVDVEGDNDVFKSFVRHLGFRTAGRSSGHASRSFAPEGHLTIAQHFQCWVFLHSSRASVP